MKRENATRRPGWRGVANPRADAEGSCHVSSTRVSLMTAAKTVAERDRLGCLHSSIRHSALGPRYITD